MPIAPLKLDDRSFDDLVRETRALIPRFAKPWTNHNTADPGIMLIELFAWLSEAMLYRINRVPDASRVRLLELLGAGMRSAEPAVLALRMRWRGDSGAQRDGKCTLRAGMPLRLEWGALSPRSSAPFVVMDDVDFTQHAPVKLVKVQQTEAVTEILSHQPTGLPLQLCQLKGRFVFAPQTVKAVIPQVMVAGAAWECRPNLRCSRPSDRHFAHKSSDGTIAFGDGKTGAIPPPNAEIVVRYLPARGVAESVEEKFASDGRPWQRLRLTRPIQPFSLDARAGYLPEIIIRDGASGTFETWEYVSRFLDMELDALQFTIEPWHNAIRFGNGTHGRMPGIGAAAGFPRGTGLDLAATKVVLAAYQQTRGAAGNVPPGSRVVARFDRPEYALMEVEACEVTAMGRDPTSIDEARQQVLELLRPDWRAVTVSDFESVVKEESPDAARVVCVPCDDRPSATHAPRHDKVAVAVVAKAKLNVADAGVAGARRIWSVKDRRAHLVTITADSALLSNVRDGRAPVNLDARIDDGEPPAHVTGAAFSSDGRRLITISEGGPAFLWDVDSAERITALLHPASLPLMSHGVSQNALAAENRPSQLFFSGDGRSVVATFLDGQLWTYDATTGAPLRGVALQDPTAAVTQGPGTRVLVATHGPLAKLILRPDEDAIEIEWMLKRTITAAVFSPLGSHIACAHDAPVVSILRLGSWVETFRRVPCATPGALDPRLSDASSILTAMQVEIGLDQPASFLRFSQDGTRLVTHSGAGSAELWSTRTAGRMAMLSSDAAVTSSAFSLTGSMVATAHEDNSVRWWDGRSGRMAAPALPQPGLIQAVLPSPSGRRITVLSDGGGALALRAWEIRDGQTREIADRMIEPGQPVVVGGAGRWIAFADKQLVRVWDVEECSDSTTFAITAGGHLDPAADWRLDIVDRAAGAVSGAPKEQAPMLLFTPGSFLEVLSCPANKEHPGSRPRCRARIFNAMHVRDAEEALHERRLITCKQQVQGPVFVDVEIRVRIARRSQSVDRGRVEAEVRGALQDFFDPLSGGPDSNGWPLGRNVYSSELCQVIEALDTVDHVIALTLNGKTDMASVPPLSLVRCIIAMVEVD